MRARFKHQEVMLYIALVQNNPKVGALNENAEAIIKAIDRLADSTYPPDLVVFPAFALTGLPLDGLSYSMAFAAEILDVSRRLVREARLPALVGTVIPRKLGEGQGFSCEPEVLYCRDGDGGILGFARSDYDESASEVENDYPGSSLIVVKFDRLTVGIALDAYPEDDLEMRDCDLVIMLLAKDYHGSDSLFTSSQQIEFFQETARENRCWLLVSNLVGGQDDIVFDGGALAIAPNGELVGNSPVLEESVLFCSVPEESLVLKGGAVVGAGAYAGSDAGGLGRGGAGGAGGGAGGAGGEAANAETNKQLPLLPFEADWRAICLAIRDYVAKNGFSDVVIGLSGGLDSSVVAALAVDALGPEHVHGVVMSSPHTSEASVSDAQELAKNLQIDTIYLPIDDAMESFRRLYLERLDSEGSELARQNIQPRIRMIHLMHLANDFGWLVLNTSNKSESAMGYSTLYGDSAGAFAPLGSTYKTGVYGLAEFKNQRQTVIPASVLAKPPSAELYEGQLDADSLPPYEVLDTILKLHIEGGLGIDQIIEASINEPLHEPLDAALITDVLVRVQAAEFKRRQQPVTPSLGRVDFNHDRNWPVTNGFSDHSRGLYENFSIGHYLGFLSGFEQAAGWNFHTN